MGIGHGLSTMGASTCTLEMITLSADADEDEWLIHRHMYMHLISHVYVVAYIICCCALIYQIGGVKQQIRTRAQAPNLDSKYPKF